MGCVSILIQSEVAGPVIGVVRGDPDLFSPRFLNVSDVRRGRVVSSRVLLEKHFGVLQKQSCKSSLFNTGAVWSCLQSSYSYLR